MIAPNLISDINGQYRGTDLKIHNSDEPVYTVFSLWDTFRSAHPLYNIIERDKTASFLNTFLKQFKDGGQLPIWELSANYTGCMIGYHVVSVILDAYVKGIPFNKYKELFSAMKEVSNRNKLGIPYYKKMGIYLHLKNQNQFPKHWNTLTTIGVYIKWLNCWRIL